MQITVNIHVECKRLEMKKGLIASCVIWQCDDYFVPNHQSNVNHQLCRRLFRERETETKSSVNKP